MSHPLTGNLEKLSDSDLQKKITELGKRLTFAYQTGNSHVINQIEMLMEDYREESRKRDYERMKKLDESNKDKGKDWCALIDV